MFEEIRANKEKTEEQKQRKRFEELQTHAETVLGSLRSMDITINEAGMILKMSMDALNRRGGELKMSSIA